MGLVAAAALLAGVLAPLPVHANSGDLLLYVRVEGLYENVFRGWVDVPDQVTFTAHNSGATYTIEGHTPLGALLAASQSAGFDVDVTDEFLGMDFLVVAIAGEWAQGLRWWDERVNSVATYYGDHYGWLAFGPGLRTGDDVLWYWDGIGVTPLRASYASLGPVPTGGCAFAVHVWERFPDVQHRAGNPWPAVTWAPVSVAQLEGTSSGPVAGGATIALVPSPGGTVWADEAEFLPTATPHLVRSDALRLPCAA